MKDSVIVSKIKKIREPKDNFREHILLNSYPARGIVNGKSSLDDSWFILYWIMGRIDHSRNRRFLVEGPILRTEPVDLSVVTDPELIIYSAMLELPGKYIVSNGNQTQTIVDTLKNGGSFDAAVASREREPDAPNYTPRISGILELSEKPRIIFNIRKVNLSNSAHTDGVTYWPTVPSPGLGFCLTTYMRDGSPLPSFMGDPLIVPMEGTPEDVLQTYWDALDSENRISIALKHITCVGSSNLMVINRY